MYPRQPDLKWGISLGMIQNLKMNFGDTPVVIDRRQSS